MSPFYAIAELVKSVAQGADNVVVIVCVNQTEWEQWSFTLAAPAGEYGDRLRLRSVASLQNLAGHHAKGTLLRVYPRDLSKNALETIHDCTGGRATFDLVLPGAEVPV